MTDKKILMAESLPWNAFYKIGSHHYAHQFLNQGCSVCWIANPVSPWHRFSRSYKKYASELDEKYRAWFRGGIQEGRLLAYAPLTLLPFGNNAILNREFVLRNTLRLTLPPLGSYLKRKNFSSVSILWFTNPVMSGLLDIVEHRCAVFRIADDLSAFKNIPATIRKQEELLVERADVVFVTAKTILDRFASGASGKIHYLPNGVDFAFFHGADRALPEAYNDIPSPRAVYVGAISDWFNLEMVRRAAEQSKDISFVLIGEPRIDLSKLSAMKNIFILGGKAYGDIPAYLKNADVGMIPFKKSALVQSINPIKLYEYMACGLPVVASRWKTLEDANSPALLADSPEEFAGLIRTAVERTNDKKEFINFARKNSWADRFNYAFSTVRRFM